MIHKCQCQGEHFIANHDGASRSLDYCMNDTKNEDCICNSCKFGDHEEVV
jgi:hypothetical protein